MGPVLARDNGGASAAPAPAGAAPAAEEADEPIVLKGLKFGKSLLDGEIPGEGGDLSKTFSMHLGKKADFGPCRAREERAELVLGRDGPRGWRVHPALGREEGEEPAGTVNVADTLRLWTDPQPLTRFLELAPEGEREVHGRRALVVWATPRENSAFAGPLAPLGWGAERWELLVDAERGTLLGTTATFGDRAFRRVEAAELALDEELDAALFAPPPP